MSLDNHGIPDEILDGIFAEEDTERAQKKTEMLYKSEGSNVKTGTELQTSLGNSEDGEEKEKQCCMCQRSIRH